MANLSRSLVDKGHKVDVLNMFGSGCRTTLWAERLKRARYFTFLLSDINRLKRYNVILFAEPLYPQNLLLLIYLKKRVEAQIVLWINIPRLKSLTYYLPIDSKFPAFVTSEKAYSFAKNIAARVEFLPSGVDTGKLQPLITDKKWDFLYIGHLMKEKGVYLLLRAMLILKEKNCSLKLKIIHDSGAEEPRYKKYITKNKLDNVDLEMSIINNHQSVYNSARVFVYPGISYYNVADVPLTIIEASACGLPVVTTSLYKHINLPNIVYTDPNPEALAQAMLKATETWNGEKQAQTLNAIQREYSLENLGNLAETYFVDLLASKRG